MGDHRAEPPSPGQWTPEPGVARAPGRRRAEVPVDSVAQPVAYVGRRVALLEREPAAAPTSPAAQSDRPGFSFSDDTMESVLGALEPIDQTTSFADEPTERLPMLRPGDLAPSLDDTMVDIRLDLAAMDLPVAQPVAQRVAQPVTQPVTPRAGGRRRATRTKRPPILGSLPSVPVLLGLAALAASIGGALTVQDHAPSSAQAAALTPVWALTGTSLVGQAGGRPSLVTRSDDRRNAGTPLVAAANGAAAERTAALAKFDRKSDAYSKVLVSNQWITPITPGVYHLTARFGQYGLWANYHTGLDFACPTGTPIHAIASGTVIFAQYDGSYGNKTAVRLADGTEIWYAHQNAFAVKVGDTVTQGQTIGYVGSTGNTTGPHVHIEVRPDGGDPIDPYPAFQQHGITP